MFLINYLTEHSIQGVFDKYYTFALLLVKMAIENQKQNGEFFSETWRPKQRF